MNTQSPLGFWSGPADALHKPSQLSDCLEALHLPVFVVAGPTGLAVANAGHVVPKKDHAYPVLAYAPPLLPASLGSADFCKLYGTQCAYVGGEMANGIASVEYVAALARAGMIGFFGAAGLEPARIEHDIRRIQSEVAGLPYGSNLIHSPHDPALENATVDLYLKLGVRNVCASAYLGLTLPLVRYRIAGLRPASASEPSKQGVIATNRLIAKISRVEVARKFLSPAPEKMLRDLVTAGQITSEQARLAERVPLCDDLTAEADSGGHTDNRPAITLIPSMLALRDEVGAEFNYAAPPRVGAAGGIATPASVAAAFAMGAAYVVTGSINQACLEAGTSDPVRRMLAEAQQADVMMAPAADMFEMGVQVQVLKRGTLFPVRARKLYELYRQYNRLEDIPVDQRQMLERDYFRASLDEVWQGTRQYFESRDPAQLARAEREPRHKMALVFRAYLGRSSKWANAGEPTRQQDYQVWCGPAMGAFNEWARGSFLEVPQNRRVATIALNLLTGAGKLTRAAWLRAQGVRLPPDAEQFRPRNLSAGVIRSAPL